MNFSLIYLTSSCTRFDSGTSFRSKQTCKNHPKRTYKIKHKYMDVIPTALLSKIIEPFVKMALRQNSHHYCSLKNISQNSYTSPGCKLFNIQPPKQHSHILVTDT